MLKHSRLSEAVEGSHLAASAGRVTLWQTLLLALIEAATVVYDPSGPLSECCQLDVAVSLGVFQPVLPRVFTGDIRQEVRP